MRATTRNLFATSLVERAGGEVGDSDFRQSDVLQGERLILNGLSVKEAIQKAKEYIEANNLGRVKVNYRLRDAIFSRQRYWGEPFPIYYKDGMPYAVALDDLPVALPEVDKFLPTETGEPPLGRAKNWTYEEK